MPRGFCQSAGRPLLASVISVTGQGEESPGSMETRCRAMPGGDIGSARRPQGKCHRKQTASGLPGVRMKGWGKSPPRPQQCGRHGKPHREQDQEGVARSFGFSRFPGQPPGSVARSGPQGPFQMNGRHTGPSGPVLQNPAYRPAGIFSSRLGGRFRRRAARNAAAAGAACGRPRQDRVPRPCPFWPLAPRLRRAYRR